MKQNFITLLTFSLFFTCSLNAQTISLDPQQGFLDEILFVNISGTDTEFESGTSTCGTIEPEDISFEQAGEVFYPLNVFTSGELWIGATLDLAVPIGAYDVTVWKDGPAGCEVSCEGCFEVLHPGDITDLDLTTGGQGEELKVTISGENTFWSQATPCSINPSNVIFSQGSSTIFNADDIVVLSNDTLCAWITVPDSIDIGSFDILVGAGLGCETTCEGCFEVMFSPEIVFFSGQQNGQGAQGVFNLGLNNGSYTDCDLNVQNVYLEQNGILIYPTSVEIVDDELVVVFDIPEDAAVGQYNLIVGADQEYDCNFGCEACYEVTAAPAIVLPSDTDGEQGGQATLSIGIDNGSYTDCELTTENVYLQQNGVIIYPTSVEIIDDELVTTFDIPLDAAIGDYDLVIGEGLGYGCVFTCESCFSIAETIGVDPVFDASVAVYPNPFEDQLFIQSENILQDVTIELYDVTGRLVLSERWDELQREVINVARLPKGLYTLKLLASEGESYKRVIRQ